MFELTYRSWAQAAVLVGALVGAGCSFVVGGSSRRASAPAPDGAQNAATEDTSVDPACAEKARQTVDKRQKEGADLVSAISKAKQERTLHERLEALSALRADATVAPFGDARDFYALAGAPFELELAIHEELKAHERTWAALAFSTADPGWRLRPLGSEALEAKVSCHRFGAGWGKLKEAIETSRGPLERVSATRHVAQFPALTWDPSDTGKLELSGTYRLGGLPGQVQHSGSKHTTSLVEKVTEQGAKVELSIEHEASFTIACRPRFDGPFKVGESCDYGKSWGRRKLVVTFADAPAVGIEPGDRIAFFAEVEKAGEEQRRESAKEKVTTQTVELQGRVIYALLRGGKLLYSLPSAPKS